MIFEEDLSRTNDRAGARQPQSSPFCCGAHIPRTSAALAVAAILALTSLSDSIPSKQNNSHNVEA